MPETIGENQVARQKSSQDRLNSKLRERLGYTGIYSQRDPQQFFNNLSDFEQKKLLKRLKSIYAQILLDYFTSETTINDQIDRFVETAFFVNLPMNKVMEIHMELIDDLERQLRFKGLNTEYLSDYRLTLIDVIAHLGEMYRSVIDKGCSKNG